MSPSALAVAGGRGLTIHGTRYPVVLPSSRDPRLHLAAVIVSLQILGQAALDFRLSIAQILISLGTCALLEMGITLWRQRVIMWPASALLTGNGVAFILRVPGTRHGDWWSLRGWWIFAGVAAVSLLSKHVVRIRGRHVFNPSNFGLVLCFLALGSSRVEPFDFWWGPMSAWMAVALAIIVLGGLAILSRLRLLSIAIGFWAAFAAGIGLLALTGHAMTARWHVGPITGGYFWWVLVTSPEILVFLFFMISDPKTIPSGGTSRRVYAVAVGLLAALLIAPARTEYWSKVAVLGALAIVCAARPLLERSSFGFGVRRSLAVGAVGLAAYAGALVAAGIPAQSSAAAVPAIDTKHLPQITILPSKGVDSKLDRKTAALIAHDVVAGLRRRMERQIAAAHGRRVTVTGYRVDRLRVRLEQGQGQGPPVAVATLIGVRQPTVYAGSPPRILQSGAALPFRKTVRLEDDGGRYSFVGKTMGRGR